MVLDVKMYQNTSLGPNLIVEHVITSHLMTCTNPVILLVNEVGGASELVYQLNSG